MHWFVRMSLYIWVCQQVIHHQSPSLPSPFSLQGDWLCACCERGEPAPPPAQLVTDWQKFLYAGEVVGLVHVEGFVRNRNGDGCTEVACKW